MPANPSRSTSASTRPNAAKKAPAVAKKAPAATTKATTPAAKRAAKPAVASATKKAATKKAPAKKVAKVVKTPAKVAAVAKTAAPARKTAVAKKTPSTRAVAAKATSTKAVKAPTPVEARIEPTAVVTPPTPPATPAGRNMRPRILVGAGVALAVAIIGGGAAFALRNPAPSKEAYIVKADQICMPGNGPVTAIVKPTNYPEVSAAASAVVTATKAEVDQLTHLRPPGGDDGKQAEATVKTLTAYSGAASALKDAADKKDTAATIGATKAFAAAFEDAKTKTKTFGFGACGSGMQPGIDSTVAGATAVIKTEFLAKADGFCRAAATKMDNLPLTPDTDAGLIADINNSLGITQKLVADLRTLPAAPGDEAVVTQMLDAADKLNVKTAELRDAIAAQDIARVQAIAKEGGPLETDSNHQFDAYGLGTCGSNFGN